MKVVNKVLTDMEGTPIMAGENAKLTIGLVLMNAALTSLPQQEPNKKALSGNESVERFMFAIRMKKLAENESFEITPEEFVAYKEELPKLYPPMVSGQAIAIIEEKL